MKAIHRKRLERLADFLETEVPKRRFDMSIYAERSDLSLKPECGASACALGWATVLFPRSLKLAGGGVTVSHRLAGGEELFDTNAAVDFFGLEYREACALFGTTPSTPKQKAKQIRALLKKRVAA